MQICPSGSEVQGAYVGATSKACASECDCNDLAIIWHNGLQVRGIDYW